MFNNSVNILIILVIMETLFKKREQVCLENERNKQRVEMEQLIEKYNNALKSNIVKFYETYPKEIDRMIQVCKELKVCVDSEKLKSLQHEYQQFRRKCIDFGANLTLYNRDSFPNWDTVVSQEWLLYWNIPVFLGGGGTSYEDIERLGQKYHNMKYTNNLEIAIDQSYKGDEIWISFVDIILSCHRWRERYNLQHLDAIVLHAM
jgi:hypothetical protein